MNFIEEGNIVAIVNEINVIKGKVPGWWYDICAIVHVLYDKLLFQTYCKVDGDQEIQICNKILDYSLKKN